MNLNDEIDISFESPTISLEVLYYDIFYKQRGIRRQAQLQSPALYDMTTAELPRNSVYHYNPESPLLLGPLETNPWYARDSHMKFINHTYEFKVNTMGALVHKPGTGQQYVTAYRRRHRGLKLIRDFFGINKNPNLVMVENYCILNHLWKYRPQPLMVYYRFFNLYGTIMKRIDELGDTSSRQQFFEIRLPTTLQPKPVFRLQQKAFETELSRRLLKYFSNDNALLLFHLWLWVGTERHRSIFNYIKPKNYEKVNLIFTDGSKYTILNLEKLNSWRLGKGEGVDYLIDSDGEEDEDLVSDEIELNDKGEPPAQLQNRFYKFLTYLFDKRSSSTSAIIDIPKYTEAELSEDAVDEEDDIENEPTETASVITPTETQKEDPLKDVVEEVVKPKRSRLPELPGTQQQALDIPTTKKEEKPVVQQVEVKDNDVIEIDDIDEDVSEYMTVDDTSIQPTKPDIPTVENELVDYGLQDAKEYVEAGQMSANEYEKYKAKLETYKTLPNPFGDTDETLEQYLKIDDNLIDHIDKTKVPDSPWVLDKSMLESSTESFDKQYIQKILNRNVAQSIMAIQRTGIAVTGFERIETKNVIDQYQTFKVKIQPLGGKESTISFKLPLISEEGEMLSKGSRYYLKKQRRDKVIRKVNPTKVALTTAYGKAFVMKSPKQKYNLRGKMIQNIQSHILSTPARIIDVVYNNVFEPEIKLPSIYGDLATRFELFTFINDLESPSNHYTECNFNYTKTHEDLDSHIAQLEQQHKAVYFATTKYLAKPVSHSFIKEDNTVLTVNTKTGEETISTLANFLKFESPLPIEIAEIRTNGKSVPIGIVLGYYMGITPLMRVLGVKPRKLLRGSSLKLTEYEYPIRFADEIWIFDKRDYKAQLILGGFSVYSKYVEDYAAEQYEYKDVYAAILRQVGFSTSYEEELTYLLRLFIDDISAQQLRVDGEPTEYIPLLIRAVELLTDLVSRSEVNMEDMLITGYSRVAMHVYTELVNAIKENKRGNTLSRGRFDFKEYRIMRSIQEDASVELVDDINPIQALKQKDLVTFTGTGGRSTRTLVGSNRAYDKTDLGTISEATVDNANVGSTVYLSANPKLKSLYGNTERADIDEGIKPSELLSVSSMLAVGSTTDDPKRTLFTSVQNGHTIPIKGAIPQPVRTGYETVIAHRLDKRFAIVAKEDGVVSQRTKSYLVITYNSGKKEKVATTVHYGVSAGACVKNPIVSELELGAKVKQGDVVAYNPMHFTRDYFNPAQVVYRNSAIVRTTFMESDDTEEDGSAVSEALADAMTSTVTKIRILTIPFNTVIHDLVPINTELTSENILCTLEDGVFSATKVFSEDAVASLKNLAQTSPKARYHGILRKMEVLYYGNLDNASESVRRIIENDTKERTRLATILEDGTPHSGELTESIKIEGNTLLDDHLVLKFYIEHDEIYNSGDK